MTGDRKAAGFGTVQYHRDWADVATARRGDAGALVRLHHQPVTTSAELVEKAGEAYAHLVYIELAALLEPLRRLRCEDAS